VTFVLAAERGLAGGVYKSEDSYLLRQRNL